MRFKVYRRFYHSSGDYWDEFVDKFEFLTLANDFCDGMNDQFIREGGWFFVKVEQ
jgi:hypothetical protein